MAAPLDGDLLAALAFASVYEASTDARGAIDPAAEGITAYAIAAVLGQSRETVRRKILSLTARGALREASSGMATPVGVLAAPPIRDAARAVVGLTHDLAGRLAAADLAPADLAERLDGLDPDLTPGLILRVGGGFCLRVVEDLSRLGDGDVVRSLVFCALGVANTRHLAPGPGAPYRDFHPPMPLAARRPITALALAEELGMPRETVRRYIRRLVEDGSAVQVRGGFVVAEAVFDEARVRATNRRIVTYLRRLVSALSARQGELEAEG